MRDSNQVASSLRCEKLNLPQQICATYQIITPMFIGDAEQKATGISPQSFKGALRFWWRALAWGWIRKIADNDAAALKELHHQEALLFGSSATKPNSNDIYGKGLVAVKITQPKKLSPKVTDWPPNSANNSSSYLAYGITESGSKDKKNDEPHREGLSEGCTFTVTLLIKKGMADDLIEQLMMSLKTIGLFSGLGSRSRRALGAVQLTQLDGQNYHIADIADYQAKVNTLLSSFKTTECAPYTAFSQNSKIAISSSLNNSARTAHATLGQLYKNYRGQPSSLRGTQKKVFGLPLKDVDEQARRSSPLFFHIFEFADKKFGYSVLYLPSSIFHKDNRHNNVDYQLLEDFMNLIGEKQS